MMKLEIEIPEVEKGSLRRNEMIELRPSVQKFAEAMERSLQAHDSSKDGWFGLEFSYLMRSIYGEVEELRDAILDRKPDEIRLESVDLANYAMMVFENSEQGVKK